MAVTIRKVVNSLTLTIFEVAKELGLSEGNTVFLARTPNGFEVTPYDSNFEKAVDAARKFMRKYTNTMKELAE